MKKLLLTIYLAAASVLAFAASEFTIDAPAVVYAGEQFRINFTANAEGKISDFQWEGSPDIQVVWGPSTSTSSNISIINGKRTSSKTCSYSYVVYAPTSSGTYTIPAATIKISGNRVSSGEKTIEVVAANNTAPQAAQQSSAAGNGNQQSSSASASQGRGQQIFLKLTTSKNTAVVGETLTGELKLYTKVNIAGFEDVHFPSFEGFWNKETFTPEQIEFHREQYNGEIYDVAVLRKYALVPQKTGELEVEPAEIVAVVNVRKASTSIWDDFFDSGYSSQRYRLITDRQTINVKPLPAGAPASFCGGVGSFEVSALLSKDSLSVHEATTLTIVVKGTGNISLLKEPKVKYPLDVESYEPKTSQNISKNGLSGVKTYEIPIIPRSAGTFTIEPIPFTYYDSKAGVYKTIYTQPLVLRVAKGAGDASGGAVSGLVSSYNQAESVRTLAKDIKYISSTSGNLVKKGDFFYASGAFVVIVVLIMLVAVVLFVVLGKVAAARKDVVGRRIKKASKAAQMRLKVAKNYMENGVEGAFYEELHRALVGYISDKLNLAAIEMSKDMIAEKLSQKGVAKDITDELTSLLEDCEMARYAPSAVGGVMNDYYTKAGEVISTIDRDMKNGNTSSLKGLVIALMILPCTSGALFAAEQVDSLFVSGVEAYAEGDYYKAVQNFKAVGDAGYESCELYTNLASSYYKCGELAYAVLYYNKALKLDPTAKDVQYSLSVVQSQLRDKIDEVPEFILRTWSNRICYSLSSNTWCGIFIVFFAFLMASLVVFFLARSSSWKKASFGVAVVSLFVGLVALIYTSRIKREYFARDRAVVVESVVAVKNAPAVSGTADLFILHEGATVKILDTIGSFVNIEISDGRSGWVQETVLEIF